MNYSFDLSISLAFPDSQRPSVSNGFRLACDPPGQEMAKYIVMI